MVFEKGIKYRLLVKPRRKFFEIIFARFFFCFLLFFIIIAYFLSYACREFIKTQDKISTVTSYLQINESNGAGFETPSPKEHFEPTNIPNFRKTMDKEFYEFNKEDWDNFEEDPDPEIVGYILAYGVLPEPTVNQKVTYIKLKQVIDVPIDLPDQKILLEIKVGVVIDLVKNQSASSTSSTELPEDEENTIDIPFSVFANEVPLPDEKKPKTDDIRNETVNEFKGNKRTTKYDMLNKVYSIPDTKILQNLNHVLKKRNIVASTNEGIPINSEPYSERKQKSKPDILDKLHSKGFTITSEPARPSIFGTPLPDVWFAPSPINAPKTTPVSTRVRGRLLKSVDSQIESEEEGSTNTEFTVVKNLRNGHRRSEFVDENRSRPKRVKSLLATHFSGDTSKYILGQHTNFNGNGHLRHPQRTFKDWIVSEWVHSIGMDVYFPLENGIVTIKHSGLYFIYSQIYYLDEHDTMGYRVYRNADVVLQCTVTQHSSVRKLKGNTCYTGGVEYLAEGDAVSVADITEGKYTLFEPGKSFFGMIRIGDFKY